MDVNFILRKTVIGETEIKNRANNLAPALRLLLILADGHKSIAQLHQSLLKMPSYEGPAQLEKNLNELITAGYLEDASVPINLGNEDHGSTHWSDADAQTAKQELIVMANRMLGSHAKKVVQKIESADNNKESIVSAVNDCTKLIRLFIDEDKANQLAAKGRAIIAHRG